MDPAPRAQLVERIVTTWPNGPKGMVWTEMFADHDEITFAAALDVYKHLRDTAERTDPPSIAVFLRTWRRRHTDASADRIGYRVARCTTCEGTGMRSARQVIGGVEHTVVVACADCGAGRVAVDTLRRIDEHNARENAGSRQAHGPVEAEPLPVGDGQVMSGDEYLARLVWRMGAGDAEAGEVVDIWAQNDARGAGIRSLSDQALAGLFREGDAR